MAAQISSAKKDEAPELVVTAQTTSQELIEALRTNRIEENVLKLLVDKNVDGERFLTKGFVSSIFTPQVLKNQNINSQKLIELRNSVLRSSTNATAAVNANQLAATRNLATALQDLPSLEVGANFTKAIGFFDQLANGDNIWISSLFKVVHFVANAINNISYGAAQKRCIELLESELLISANHEFILSPPQRFNKAFAKLRKVIKEIGVLAASFVPVPEDASFSIVDAEYWAAQLTSKDGDFTMITGKLNEARDDINFVLNASAAAAAHGFTNNNPQPLHTQNLDVDEYTKDLLVNVGRWYDSHFKFELGSKGNVDLKKLFVELKVLQTTNEDKKTKDQESLLNSGKIADTSSLHQHLWNNCSSLSNIVLVEGAAGIGKTTFCMKLCCLQNIQGAIVVFVPLKQLLGCGRINSISTLLDIIETPLSVINALPNILHCQIPIVWVLDGFDEVMKTDDYSVQLFLNNFLDPETRKKNLESKTFSDLVRYCDYVILTSRENRVDTNIVTIDGVKDPMLKPDLWVVQRWKRNDIEEYITNFFKKLNKPISEGDVQLLVDHSLGPQMAGFHGIPLFIELLCEAKLDDENLDLTNISAPFLYQKTLRNAFVRAKIRIEYVLDTNPQFIRYKSDLNGLYDKILDDASRHAFQEFLAHRGTALTFCVPCDENLPLWILVMREMGVLLNDTNETKFKFQHRTFIEYLAAQYVALNPVEALPLVPFSDELDTTWLLICQLACLRENDGFFKKLLEKGLTTTFLANHIAERFVKEYHVVDKKERHTENREEILKLSEKHQIKLLVQVASALPKNLFMDALLAKHGTLVLFTPSQFKWMTEWCGYYGAIDVLKWFYEKFRFRWSVLSEQNCRYALGRALQRQSASNVKDTVDFLVERAGDLSVSDAIATESTVALQMALQMKNKFDDDVLIQMFKEMIDRIDSNPNLMVAMCLFTEFTADQLKMIDLAAPSPPFFFMAISLQVQLPEFAEIWDFDKKIFNQINVVDEIKKRPIGRFLFQLRGTNKNWYKNIMEIFVKVCIPKFGNKLIKLKSFIQDLDLSLANEFSQENAFVTDATMEVIGDCFSLVRSLKLCFCKKITDAGLEHIAKLSGVTNLNLSNCKNITDAGLKHLSSLKIITSLNLSTCIKITDFGLEQISKSITTLNLSKCWITDVGLEHLSKLSNITYLNLSGCWEVTNVGLEHLSKLLGINSLDLSNCSRITFQAKQTFIALMGCSIYGLNM